ncbi:hypothetical protein ABOM_007079 [Aspergillus bombycis]|uniref:Glycerol-3-phosphate dehydrogenase NAD-dependent N-terminal domain-containing protein n=1 Tax=Aspergillus bombycis TaxID=109264 RepID=A0A1F7ZZN5_9EURO|nr:hypothetical protein ABOM_007079 [Aspergillus bombycis]OGM44932.1 hypothetical protein ABOM_007079 [Aspergillus bombycis]
MLQQQHTVAVIGSGNWYILPIYNHSNPKRKGLNDRQDPRQKHSLTPRPPHPEGPNNLTKAINAVHESVKYLPEIKLPENVVKDATILVINLPHQFIEKTLGQIKGKHLPYARAIPCVKGVDVTGEIVTLLSGLIMEKLGIYCGSFSGDTPPIDVKAEDGSPEDNKIKIDEQRQVKTRPTHTTLTRVPQELVTVDADL